MRIEGIQFYDFNSVNEGLRLLDRDVPTPQQRTVIETIPYKQGVVDFSMLLGEEINEPVPLTYTFHSKGGLPYAERKRLTQRVKRLLKTNGEGSLYDTFDRGYFRRANLVNVDPKDNPRFNRVEFNIEFTAYPYAFRIKPYFDDIFDTVDLDNDVAGYTQFEINGTRTIQIYNAGDTTVRPLIIFEGVE